MNLRTAFCLACILMLFTACAPASTATNSLPSTPTIVAVNSQELLLSMDSTSDEIQQAMLVSATKWKTIFMDGVVTWNDTTGNNQPPQVFHQQVWIDQLKFRFRYLNGPQNGAADYFKASDGATILEMDLKTGQTQSSSMPDFSLQTPQFVPTLTPGMAYPQPLWGQMGSPLGELAYSSDFAQNEGTFKPVALDQVAGRQTLVVDWTYAKNTQPSFRAWLDTATAVILKKQDFGKSGGDTVQSEISVQNVTYDAALDDSLFSAPAVTPRFADSNGAMPTLPVAATALPSGQDAQGELYFFTLPHKPGENIQLVRLPGSCVEALAACPQLESVAAPFPFNFNLSPLAWSPDGKLAAFAYPDNANGTPYKLWIFDPAADTWKSLAEFPFIDPPYWSPDGTWLAFRVQDGKGGEDVYAVHRDGSELKNLTANGKLPVAGRPYVMDGWLTENIIVRSGIPGAQGSVYLIRASDGAVQPMFETLFTKAVFFPSKDGAFLAFDSYDENSQKHVLKISEPDGANAIDGATFSGGSLYPIVWSPDTSHIAFAHFTTSTNGNPSAIVYVVGRDGRGLAQIYQGVTVGSLQFSPDGKFVLVEETTTPTGGHLFAVNLDTLEQHILSAPGLTLDTDWYAPSWRP